MPETRLECLCTMYCKETKGSILADKPDYVIDAIDNIDTKIDLLAACKSKRIQVLSVAGAGAKADPTRLRLVDIAESNACLLYTSPSPRDPKTSRMPSSA